MTMKRIVGKKWLWGIGIALLVLLLSGYLFIRTNTYKALPEAADLLQEENITQEEDWIRVTPEEVNGHIVLYQGGLVEPAAYLPLAHGLSKVGFQVFIPKMPLNLAVLNTDAIDKIKETYPSEKEWWLAGHSLGGASASIYAKEHDDAISGLVFLAAYPSNDSDLSGTELPVLSITGSNDGILNGDKYEQTQMLLPDNTVYKTIVGGNHSNFGYYGFQEGDQKSTLSREDQKDELIQYIDEFISNRRN